jgi:hypothetical protein
MSAEQATAAAERLDEGDGQDSDQDSGGESGRDGSATAGLLRLHADRLKVVERETRLRQRFSTAHPDVPSTVVPALSTDVHDLDGLRRIGDLMARVS